MRAAGSGAQTPVTRRALPDQQAGRFPPFDGSPPAARRERIGMSSRPLGARPVRPGTVFARSDFASCGESIRPDASPAPPLGDAISAGESPGATIRDEIRHETWPSPLTPVQPLRGAAPAPPNRCAEADSPRRRVPYCQVQSANSVEHATGQRGEDEITSRAPRGGRDWTRPRSASRARPDERWKAPARHFGWPGRDSIARIPARGTIGGRNFRVTVLEIGFAVALTEAILGRGRSATRDRRIPGLLDQGVRRGFGACGSAHEPPSAAWPVRWAQTKMASRRRPFLFLGAGTGFEPVTFRL